MTLPPPPPDYEKRMPHCEEAMKLRSVGADVFGREARLASAAADAWLAMQRAAEGDGVRLLLVSAFRSVARQTEIIRRKLEAGMPLADILKVSAYPGYSEHHTGRAVDIGSPDCAHLTEDFETTREYAWLTTHGLPSAFRCPIREQTKTGSLLSHGTGACQSGINRMPENMSTEMVGYYAKRAAEYDRIYDLPERQADLQKLRQLCQSRFRDLAVLEVSCGTGYWTQYIAPSARSVTAADINEEVLAIARSRQPAGVAVTFHRADSYALPDFNGSFNAGFSGFWWSHIPKRRLGDFLAGFYRQLKPGSLVVFIDNRYVPGSSTPISRTDENGDTFQRRKLSDGSTHEVLKNFPSPDELRNAVGDSGSSIEITLLDYFWVLAYQTK